ncbi:hypothetical protein C3F00_040020 [Pseudomonas sp. MWU13-2860]|nr:hypothetical protein C3F00_040020 [Pseudomonas sp. MWU13-2860]
MVAAYVDPGQVADLQRERFASQADGRERGRAVVARSMQIAGLQADAGEDRTEDFPFSPPAQRDEIGLFAERVAIDAGAGESAAIILIARECPFQARAGIVLIEVAGGAAMMKRGAEQQKREILGLDGWGGDEQCGGDQ